MAEFYGSLDNELSLPDFGLNSYVDFEQEPVTDNNPFDGGVFYVEVGKELTQGVGEWKEMTLDELEEFYNDDPLLEQTFGDFDKYASYMGELTGLYDSGELVRYWTDEYQDASNPYDAEGNLKEGRNPLEVVQGPQQNQLSESVAALNEKYGLAGPNGETGYYQPITDENGDKYQWNGTSWTKTWDKPEQSLWDQVFKAGVMGAIAIGFGGATAGALGGALGSTAAGAVGGAVGSAVSGAISGDITAEGLLKGAILGGIGGLADGMLNGDLAGTALDDAVWELSDVLGMSYDETLSILEGVASGAINGEGIEGIVGGVVGSIGSDKVMDYLQDYFGDEFVVEDWFKDGQSNIPTEALQPIVDQVVGGIIDGSIDDPGAWAQTLYDYFEKGGDVDFALPGVPEGGDWKDWLGGVFPDFEFPDIEGPDVDIDIDLPNLPDVDIDLPDVDLPDLPDIDVDLPDIDIPDVDLPDLPDIDVDLPDVDLPDIPDIDVDLPEIDIDLPDYDFDPELPDVEFPEIDGPDLDVDLPDVDIDVPDLPSVDAQASAGPEFTPEWTGLFAYTQLTEPQKKALAPYKDFIAQAKGMLS